MAIQEVICPSCGAINQMIADACWRCLEALAPAPTTASAQEPQTRRPAIA
jgi:predicted amidophosphoribosyltransferase